MKSFICCLLVCIICSSLSPITMAIKVDTAAAIAAPASVTTVTDADAAGAADIAGMPDEEGAAVMAVEIKIYVDGRLIAMDVPPIIYDDRTLVPIRAISESIGCNVAWFDDDQRIVIYTPIHDDPFMEMRIDDANVKITMHDYTSTPPVTWIENAAVDVRPMIYNDRTFLPLRFVAEWMGFAVDWADAEQAVRISSPDDAALTKKLTGLWHAMNMVGAGYDERYAFYADGSFVHASRSADTRAEVFRMGAWSVTGGRLVFRINARIMAENGYIDTFDGIKYLLDADYVVRPDSNPIAKSYSIAFTGADPDTGRQMLEINYQPFYAFNNQIDLMSDYETIAGKIGWLDQDGTSAGVGGAVKIADDINYDLSGGKLQPLAAGVIQKGCFYHNGMGEWLNFYYVEIGARQFEYIIGHQAASVAPPIEIQVYSTVYDLDEYLGRYIEFWGEGFEAQTIHHRRDYVFEITLIK